MVTSPLSNNSNLTQYMKVLIVQLLMYKWEKLIPLQQKPKYIPSEEEFMDYVEFLGIDLPEDEDLLPIAREGIQASLPEDWEACRDVDGDDDDLLYRNLITRQITDQHPADKIYKNKIAQIKLIKHQLQNRQQDQVLYEQESHSSSRLSEIKQEQNDAYNESQVYEPIQKPNLNIKDRIDIINSKKQQIKSKLQNKSKEMPKYVWNNQLDKNISEESFKDSKQSDFTYQHANTKGILPSSLMDLELKSQEIGRMYDKVDTQLTDKLQKYSKQLNSRNEVSKIHSFQSHNLQISDIAHLKKYLTRLEEQEKLKMTLLKQIKQSNQEKIDQIKEKIHKKSQKRQKAEKYTKN